MRAGHFVETFTDPIDLSMLLPWAFGIICSKTGFTCSRFCASPGDTPSAIAVNASFTKTVRMTVLIHLPSLFEVSPLRDNIGCHCCIWAVDLPLRNLPASGGYALDEKVCSFRRTHLRSDFVKRLTFNSGSFHCISDGEDPKSKEISWQRPFNTYFLFIVRSRNSCINNPIRSTSSSNAKWPVSRRWSSALGISLL